jgi:UTP--glucose-1-phosphate uridylyltransferase
MTSGPALDCVHQVQFRSNQGVTDTVATIRKCLFPAAGYGTRFLPATKAMPKEMLPIVDKPLIQYGVEEAIDAGLTQIGVISGRGKRAIEDHFDISYELEHQISGTPKESLLEDVRHVIDTCTFSYTRQIEMKGLGHAILTGQTLIGDEPFAVLLADDMCCNGEGDGVLKQMVNLFNEYQCSIVAIEEVPADQTQNYGVIDGQEIQPGLFKVSNMVEKPAPEDAPTNMAIIGRYILTPDIFDIIRHIPPGKGGEIQITDAICEQAQNRMVLAYRFEGRRFDCGSIEGFVEATNYIFQKNHS